MGNSNATRFKDVSPAVTVKGMASGFAQNIAAGQHQLTSDEPVEVGGTDQDHHHTSCCSRLSGLARR